MKRMIINRTIGFLCEKYLRNMNCFLLILKVIEADEGAQKPCIRLSPGRVVGFESHLESHFFGL
jgi:hypothetical protein